MYWILDAYFKLYKVYKFFMENAVMRKLQIEPIDLFHLADEDTEHLT